MKIKLLVTKSCNHRSNIEKELNEIGMPYEVVYAEDNPEEVIKYDIRHSPNIIVDDVVICRGQPSEGELKALLLTN